MATDGSDPTTNYYACLRPRGRRVLIGRSGGGDSEYGQDFRLTKPVIAGTFAAAIETDGLVSATVCAKYTSAEACPKPQDFLRVADARSRRTAKLAIANQGNTLVALSAGGAAAWYSSPTALFAARFGGLAQPVVVQAPIVPATVALSPEGLLTWQDTGGAPHSMMIS